MKRILLATDLSANAERALARAGVLARDHKADLRVLHVVDDPHLPTRYAEMQRAASETFLKESVDKVASETGISASVSTTLGRPAAEILRQAISWPADLIVIGAHSADLLDMFRGTTVERVIREGNLPVLVVRSEGRESYRRAVVAIDFSLHSLRAAQAGFRLAPEAEFELVHAYVDPSPAFLQDERTQAGTREGQVAGLKRVIEEEMAALVARFSERTPPPKQIIAEGFAVDVLLSEVDRCRADLLVVGTHGRTGVAHAFLGSVAETLVRRAPCDVLVAKAW